MTSEKSAPSAARGTAERSTSERAASRPAAGSSGERTRTLPPVPPPPVPDDTTVQRRPAPEPVSDPAPAPGRVEQGGVEQDSVEQDSVEQDASAEGNGSGVKDGAVKAAAAALAAARSAAKKVQAAASSIGQGSDEYDDDPAPREARRDRPQMHYQAGGFRGAAVADSPAPATGAHPAVDVGPRRVRLSVSRIDPWSIMKLAFLLAVAIGVMNVVATAVIWYVLNDLGVFATIQDFVRETVGAEATVNILQFVEFERMVSLATLISLVNIVLMTAIATIMAILYNITAALVGGIHLTLTDE
jgi:hypothetical protein